LRRRRERDGLRDGENVLGQKSAPKAFVAPLESTSSEGSIAGLIAEWDSPPYYKGEGFRRIVKMDRDAVVGKAIDHS
jgi:hypothetical protein